MGMRLGVRRALSSSLLRTDLSNEEASGHIHLGMPTPDTVFKFRSVEHGRQRIRSTWSIVNIGN